MANQIDFARSKRWSKR